MAGYSGTPLARKLGIKAGSAAVLVGAPPDFESELAPLPDGAIVVREVDKGATDYDLAVLFVTERCELERLFPEVSAHVHEAGGVWIAWPKKASKVATDLTEDVLREVLLPTGWVDTKVCAVTSVWSGLRFVLRVSNRLRA
jgi:hypothetical protein